MAFPLSDELDSARLAGLRAALCERDELRIGLRWRKFMRFFLVLGGKRPIEADASELLGFVTRASVSGLLAGDLCVGDNGEFGVGEEDLEVISRNAGPFDGDLERDCRSCSRADGGALWGLFDGEGKCKVPPPSR